MDDPSIDPQRHEQALRGLARLNRWSGSARIIWNAVHQFARQRGLHRVRLLDIATGAGDVPIGVMRLARQAGLEMKVVGCDASETALTHARDRAKRAGADIEYFRIDALADELPGGFDVITSSLFLHHLENRRAALLLKKIARATQGAIVVNDLRRSRKGLALAYVASRSLTRSDVVQVDAIRSVRAAFTIEEAKALSDEAGLAGASITPCWPCRYRLVWSGGGDRR